MFGTLLKSIEEHGQRWSNWAGNVSCHAKNIFFPRSEDEILIIIDQAIKEGACVRVVGSGHSFSQLVETEDYIVSLVHMTGLVEVNKEEKWATVRAGTSIKEANEALYRHGLAMINLGDIDVQSVAGATATGTHGTGVQFGNVSTEIINFTMAMADGQLLFCSKEENPMLFEAGRVGLGALGIITQITFRLDEAYKLEFESSTADFEDTLEQLEDYNSQNRNFEFYYFPFSDTVQLKKSNKTDKPVQSNKLVEHINDVFLENTVMQLVCKVGTWFPSAHKTISRFAAKAVPKGSKVNFSHEVYATVRNVRFKEMEYNVPIEHFKTVISKLKAMIEERSYFVFFPIECRFVKQDDIWLSPAYKRDSAYIAIHVYHETPHNPYFEEIEALFMEYEGRPHWGKMHTRTADYFREVYPRWNDFMILRAEWDPEGVFLNTHLQEVFGL